VAKRYMTVLLKRENGDELNAILPKMSPLNLQYLTQKLLLLLRYLKRWVERERFDPIRC
jgi:hypothetical protein